MCYWTVYLLVFAIYMLTSLNILFYYKDVSVKQKVKKKARTIKDKENEIDERTDTDDSDNGSHVSADEFETIRTNEHWQCFEATV